LHGRLGGFLEPGAVLGEEQQSQAGRWQDFQSRRNRNRPGAGVGHLQANGVVSQRFDGAADQAARSFQRIEGHQRPNVPPVLQQDDLGRKAHADGVTVGLQ
jgi:hypothetical protein